MKDPTKIYEENIGSIVAVHTDDGGGSGVVVGENLVATNAHVVDSGGKIVVEPVKSESGQPAMVEAKIIAASDRDLCLLEAEGLSLPSVKIGAAESLRVGNPVYAIGAPRGFGGTLSNGIVSRRWEPPANADILHPLRALPGPLIQTNTAVSPGSSGGGVFDDEGRLVGITTFGEGNLNFAVPAEMIGQLQKCDEKNIRRDIDKVLGDRFRVFVYAEDPNELPEIISGLALMAFSDLTSEDVILGNFLEMGRCAAMLGDGGLPEKVLHRFREIAKADGTVETEHRVLAKFGSAVLLSAMGAERIDEAVRLIESIDYASVQVGGYAFIAADCARHEGRDSPKAREVFDRIRKIPDDDRKAAYKMPSVVGALAMAHAAMGDSEGALVLVDRHINEWESDDYFLKFVGALAEIAATLTRQKVAIGAKAIFDYAERAAIHRRAQGVGAPERIVALGMIAATAAECGDDSTARTMLQRMKDIRKKGAASTLSEDGTPDIPYRRRIEARGLEARARAAIGDWLEMHAAFEVMKRIPVLEHLSVALACAACRMRQEAKAKKD